jgi:hypothetical protein
MNFKELGCGMNLLDSEKGQVAGSCEHSNEPLSSIKCGELSD